MTTKLTPAQEIILRHATQHIDGKIDWFPDNIKGGARKKVIEGLFNRAFITPLGSEWFVAAEGYDALGLPRPGAVTLADPEIEAAVSAAEASWQCDAPKPKTRKNSKQATVIAMLQRPEGATIGQIVESTGWQAHTVRGTFAGALKKKLGLTIVSDKAEGNERTYRIV